MFLSQGQRTELEDLLLQSLSSCIILRPLSCADSVSLKPQTFAWHLTSCFQLSVRLVSQFLGVRGCLYFCQLGGLRLLSVTTLPGSALTSLQDIYVTGLGGEVTGGQEKRPPGREDCAGAASSSSGLSFKCLIGFIPSLFTPFFLT